MKNFFDDIHLFLKNDVAPISNALDHDVPLLKKIYQQLIELNVLQLLVPSGCGGLGGDRAEWIEYNILLSQYSGALLFLQAQHQFAVTQLKKLLPAPKAVSLLKKISEETLALGIAFAANKKQLQVTKVKDGFELSGKLFWVTGFDCFSSVLLSFDIDKEIYYALLPFQNMPEKIIVSSPTDTIVFSSANTVSVTLDRYFISNDEIIGSWHEQGDVMEHPVIYNFAGAAKALLEISTRGKYYYHAPVKEKYASLLNQWENYYKKIIENKSHPRQLRAEGLLLAEQCIHFARIVCGAESILASHPMNRLAREIWQYSVSGYSEKQLEAYLEES